MTKPHVWKRSMLTGDRDVNRKWSNVCVTGGSQHTGLRSNMWKYVCSETCYWLTNINKTLRSAVTLPILHGEGTFYHRVLLLAKEKKKNLDCAIYQNPSFLCYHILSFPNVSAISVQNLYSSLSSAVCMLHNNYAWSYLQFAFPGGLTSWSHASATKDSLNLSLHSQQRGP